MSKEEHTMKFLKILRAVLLPLVTALLCWSCEVVALGSLLDLNAPRLTISRPAFAETVPENFELAGAVEDNVMTTELTVSIEKISREWRNLRGAWETRETPEEAWLPCEGAWIRDGTRVSWTLPISLTGIKAGEYVITVNSFDEVRNNDAQSVQRVKITYNNANPFLTILNLVLKTGNNNRVPQDLENMDDNSRRDLSLLGEIFNESLTLNYEIEGGDFSSGGSLAFYLSGKPSDPDLDKPELIAGDVWYEKTIPLAKRNGSLVISHAEILDPSDGLPNSDRTPLRLISRVTDSLGRTEYKSSGWFMWWPESDKPWAVFPAGSDPHAASYTGLYAGGENTTYAYDDDGAASLKYRIYEWDRVNGKGSPATEETSISFGENESEWTFIVPKMPGDYMIEAAVTDIHGLAGDADRAYFTAKKRPAVEHKYLTRISSSNPDGYYTSGANNVSGVTLEITLDFDVPVKIPGDGTPNTPKLELNLENANSAVKIYAAYDSGTGTNTLKFKYQTVSGDHSPGTNPLNVVNIDTSTGDFTFADEYGDEVNINSEINIPADPDYRLSGQKKIYLIRGAPAMSPPVLDEKGVLTVNFTWAENPFTSWNLVRGSGDLVLEIKDDEYRIPAVIPEARYLEYGLAAYKDISGNPYYERTINGAFADGRTDTDPKYVLRLDLDPADFESSAASSNHKDLRKAIKDKETISLSAYSSQVTLNGHTMTVNLGSLLPVKGVSYRCAIPAGFLGVNPIGLSSSQKDVNVLFPGVEKPFFRIEKADETLQGSGNNRQARQPVTARVKLDCRTPNAKIYHTDPTDPASFTTDPVEDHLFESQSGYLTPHPKPENIDFSTNKPMGTPADKPVWREPPHPPALPPLHTPAKSDTNRTKLYGGPFEIGDDNYALGGMAYRLIAVAYPANSNTPKSDPSYEVAYRSVLVFNNTVANEYSQVNGLNGGGGGIYTTFTNDFHGNRTRIWITGGDSVAGAVLTPGFPLDWIDNTGVRLMTPIGSLGVIVTNASYPDRDFKVIGGHTNTKGNGSNNLDTTLTHAYIPGNSSNTPSYNPDGHYTWYWITWKLGTAAYVQFQRRMLTNVSGSSVYFDSSEMSPLKQGWNTLKEYYPVFPGETRVVNPRTPYWYLPSGSNPYWKYVVLGQKDAATKWGEVETP
jgi:hypothetical protein